jgi:tRNA U34 5-methylaminomethyl-2-thiouridine-forming methyltransferase MnmC
MQYKIIITSDGSHSIYIPELNEHYHSIHGAIQESKHVFIEAGLKHFISSPAPPSHINILEIGFGTGLNAFLTFIEARNANLKIKYTTIEAFPLKKEIVEELNYVSELDSDLKDTFDQLHYSDWEKEISISENFILRKIGKPLQNVNLKAKEFDLIYFDAFGPPVQPEMWTESVFSKIAEATKPNGIFVTYCAKGEVKRTLKKAGFNIENLPGPPGKREMVRGLKI